MDTLVRVVVLIFAIATLVAGLTAQVASISASQNLLAAALSILAAWRPRLAAAAALALSLLSAVLVPDLLSPFLLCFSVAVGVCASQLKWWWLAQCSLAHFGAVGIAYALDTLDARYFLFTTEFFIWFVAVALGLSAALLQTQIDREIASRVDAARRAEREVQDMRLSLATDTHDTVAHALATEAAIIRVIGLERDKGVDDRTLAELGVVNARAQRQLRQLLSKLSSTSSPSTPKAFRAEMQLALGVIASGARAGGFTMSTAVADDLPDRQPASVVEATQLMLFELAGNIIKHASAQDRIELAVQMRAGTTGDKAGPLWITLSSRNPVEGPGPFRPGTLTRRARQAGGDTEVHVVGGVAEVVVRVPLKSSSDFIGANEEFIGSDEV